MKKDIKWLEDNNLIIFKVITGSQAYGTNTETSDTDIRGVYISPIEDLYTGNIVEDISDKKNDECYYELGKFISLLSVQNPSMLEILNSPKECILYKHDLFDLLLNNKDLFLTKHCSKTFGGYANTQIKKAKGLDKKLNWEGERIKRKDPMDFCYLLQENNTIPLKKYLIDNKLDSLFCGVSKVNHTQDIYSLYYDFISNNMFNITRDKFKRKWSIFKVKFGNLVNLNGFRIIKGKDVMGFGGIGLEKSNTIRCSSIPKDCSDFIGYISYNESAYSRHCKEYGSYLKWLSERNEQRYIDVKGHGQTLTGKNNLIDGKNLLHCVRLLRMAKEIGEDKGIIIKRPDYKYLLDIKKGNINLNDILKESSEIMDKLDKTFSNSKLPDDIDLKKVDSILYSIRNSFYRFKN